MLTLYGVYRSRAARNYWLAEELGLDYAQVPIIQAYRLADPEAADAPPHTQSSDYLNRVITGAIPALEEGGFVLTESLAINLYLARKHGGPLAPADLKEEAQMMQWALYGATSIEPFALDILYPIAEGRDKTPAGAAQIAAAVETLRRPLRVLETHLPTSSGFMVADRFTVADINMAEILRYAQAHPTLLAEYPALLDWLSTCQARPAFKAMMENREAEPF